MPAKKADQPCEECFPGGWPIPGVEPGGRASCEHGEFDAPKDGS